MPNVETVPHSLTVSTNSDGNREYGWPHPDTCPDGDACDIQRRIQRAGTDTMAELVQGRPDGTYRLGLYGFNGLLLIDDNRNPLPEPVGATAPATDAVQAVQRIYDLAQEHDANTGLIPVSEVLNALGVTADGEGLDKLLKSEPARPTPDHMAVYVVDDEFLYTDYPTVPASDSVLRLVWVADMTESKQDIVDAGHEVRLIGWCK